MQEHLREFVDRLETEASASLPGFVREELEAFTTCGDFEQGCVRLGCQRCDEELRVPFSCKGQRMCERAAAGTTVDAQDKRGLERMCRYM